MKPFDHADRLPREGIDITIKKTAHNSHCSVHSLYNISQDDCCQREPDPNLLQHFSVQTIRSNGEGARRRRGSRNMDAIDLLFLWEENKQIKKNQNTNQRVKRVFSALFIAIGSLNDLILASSVICENPSPMQTHRELDTEEVHIMYMYIIMVESSLK